MHSLIEERRDETEKIENICVEISKLLVQDAPPPIYFVNSIDTVVDADSEYSLTQANDDALNSSVIEQTKLIGKKKKKVKKALVGDSNIKDLAESLGANEEDGFKNAINAS